MTHLNVTLDCLMIHFLLWAGAIFIELQAKQCAEEINNDYDRGVETLVTGWQIRNQMGGNENDAPASALGLVHHLNEKLQNSLLSFCRSNTSKYNRDKSNALHCQRAYRAQ